MMKKLAVMAAAGMIAFFLVACTSENTSEGKKTETESGKVSTVALTHELGTVEVPYDPQKIAVLDLAALDILDALGLGERVTGIPKNSSVSYLTSYIENESIANVGSVKEVDMEELNSLQPDLIFIGGRLSEEYENLSKIAPTVLVTIDQTEGYLEAMKQNVTDIASIFGEEEKAGELLAGFDQRVEALKEKAAGKTALVGLVTSGSVNTVGSAGRCSLISNEVGFDNLADDVESTHGDTASFELLVEKDPEYIFALDRDTAVNAEGAAMAKEVLENDLVKKTQAYQNGNMVYLTPDVWYLSEGGITATELMLQDLEKGIL